MARYKRKGQRQRGKKVTVAVIIGSGMHETKHRAATLAQALRVAERARVPPGCRVEWWGFGPHQKWAKGVKRLPGRAAGLDGALICRGREIGPAYAMVYRPKAQAAWHKRRRIERAARRYS